MTALPSGDVTHPVIPSVPRSESDLDTQMEHETYLIQHGYYPLEFSPHTSILMQVFQQFPKRYYKVTQPPPNAFGEEIKPIVSIIMFSEELQPHHIESFKQFWDLRSDL